MVEETPMLEKPIVVASHSGASPSEINVSVNQQTPEGLKRNIGLVGCFGLFIGTIIGSGIFASPSNVSSYVNSPGASLLVWVGCGVLAMLASLSYCELGTMFPNASGGEYHYLGQAFGPASAFLYAYTQILVVRPSQLALVSVTCGDYLSVAVLGENNQAVAKIIAAVVILIILIVNAVSVRWATIMQVAFTAAKLVAVAMLIITGFVRIGQGHVDNFKDAFNGTSTSVSNIGYAFYGGLWAYDGWNNLNYVTEELINPIHNLPLVIMSGLPFITLCYVMVNVGYLTVLTSPAIAQSNAVAVELANKLYGVMAWTIPALVACSTFGAANGCAFTSGRLVYVAAREGHMPKLLAMIHQKRNTPLPALIFTCIIAWIMLIPESSNFGTLIKYFNFAAWTFYGMSISALLWLRYSQPTLKRPYKVFIGIPILVLLCAIYLVVAPFYDHPLPSLCCLLFIFCGLLFYFMLIKHQILPKRLLRLFDTLTYKIQMMAGLSLPVMENGEKNVEKEERLFEVD